MTQFLLHITLVLKFFITLFIFVNTSFAGNPVIDGDEKGLAKSQKLEHIKTITGKISPKSIVHNGNGKFFAQNMMYRHTITVYDRKYTLLKTIKDEVSLVDYGYDKYKGKYKGAPVECAFSHNGKYAWVSNYEMRGGTSSEFIKPGCDGCVGRRYDNSYVYKINTNTYEVENVVEVGAVPKFIAATPDDRYVLVSNWTSSDLSIINTAENKEIKRIHLGRLPRGIDVNSTSTYAYVAIMGSDKIAQINLYNFKVSWIKDVGRGPRHICISPDDTYLYASINNEGKVVRINLKNYEQKEVSTGRTPRSMALSKDGGFLYVVNYSSNTVSKIKTKTMEVVDEHRTNSKPIGITFDEQTKNIWIACYTGRIMVFHDTYYDETESFILANQEKDNALKFLSYAYIAKDDEKKLEKQPKKKAPLTLKEIAELTAMEGEDRTVVVKSNSKESLIASNTKKTEKKEIKPKPTSSTLPKEKAIPAEKFVKENTKNVTGFLVITGAFKNDRNAKRRLNLMRGRGYEAGLYYNALKDLNMVYVKNCKTKEEAKQFREDKRLEAWIFEAK